MATKKKALLHRPATEKDIQAVRHDIKQLELRLEKKFATKEELREEIIASENRSKTYMDDKFASKADLKNMEKNIIHEFKATAENIHKDVAGANKDKISLLEDEDGRLKKRVSIIESHLGILAP